MKKVIIAVLALALTSVFTGCSTSPVQPVSQGSSKMQLITNVGGSVLGGVAGAMIDKNNRGRGAVIGAAAGGLTTTLATSLYESNKAQREAELQEQARRAERVKIMQDDWYNRTKTYDPETDSDAHPQKEKVEMEAGTYEGVPYFNRAREIGNPSTALIERPRS